MVIMSSGSTRRPAVAAAAEIAGTTDSWIGLRNRMSGRLRHNRYSR